MNLKIYNKIFEYIKFPKKGKDIFKDLSKEELYICEEILNNVDDVLSAKEPDYNNTWKVIDSQTKSSTYKYLSVFLKYAASIVVIASISYLSYHMYNTFTTSNNTKIAKEEPFKVKRNNANLILEGGKIIELSNDKLTTIIDNNSMKIKSQLNNVLEYEVESDSIREPIYNTIVVPKAAEYSVKLSDGTFVYLNSESKLKYPVNFIGDYRVVELEGEGYFKVKKNKKQPFIVKVGKAKISVLGTTFNINAYEENEDIKTTLVEGCVKVDYNNQDIILKPNEQAICENENIRCLKVDVTKYNSWVNGVFNFEDSRLEDIMTQIERWYDVNVFFIDQDLRDKLFSGVIQKYRPIKEILKMIEKTDNLKIRIRNDNIYIEKN